MKNVSQFLCAFTFLLISHQASMAQLWRDHMADPTYNYYTVVQEAETYFNQNPLLKTTPGSGYKPYIRWRTFWDGKVQFDNPANNGNRQLATQMYASMVSNTICNGAPANGSDWSALGPFSLPTQDIGIIIGLWVNPANHNEVLAGSNSDGNYRLPLPGLAQPQSGTLTAMEASMMPSSHPVTITPGQQHEQNFTLSPMAPPPPPMP